jgi:hypothetical protein
MLLESLGDIHFRISVKLSVGIHFQDKCLYFVHDVYTVSVNTCQVGRNEILSTNWLPSGDILVCAVNTMPESYNRTIKTESVN